MTKEECWKLIKVIQSQYPKYYERYGEAEYENLCNGFYMCLEDVSYKDASLGLKYFMMNDVKGFPPVVGQIISAIKAMNPARDNMGAVEAWALVYKAICNSTYNSEAEFNKLPPMAQKVVGRPENLKEWARMDIDTVNSVEQSHFIREYNNRVMVEEKRAMLPQSMRQAIAAGNVGMIEEK